MDGRMPALDLKPFTATVTSDCSERRLTRQIDCGTPSASASHRFRVLQVRVDRRHHDARLDGDEVDTNQRDADPRVDDDPLVEHTIEDVDETRTAGGAFNRHRFSNLTPWLASGPSQVAVASAT